MFFILIIETITCQTETKNNNNNSFLTLKCKIFSEREKYKCEFNILFNIVHEGMFVRFGAEATFQLFILIKKIQK